MKRYSNFLSMFFIITFMLFALTGCNTILEQVSPEVQPSASTVDETIPSLKSISNAKVHFIDVGQGDSILIESNGAYLLVDAGENNKGDIVTEYLTNLGITYLDYVIGTHPHSDHIGGLDDVIHNFDIGTIIMPPKEHTTKTFEDVLDAIADKGLKITKPVPGATYSLGNTTFSIIAPMDDYGDDLNNWSVGIRLTAGNTSFVMCGDAEETAENDIISNNQVLSADVLKLGHHGSRTSSTDAFLSAVSPSFAVITCGADNSYGHPHQETLDKLARFQIDVFRTDIQGSIIATTDGNTITWNTQPAIDN